MGVKDLWNIISPLSDRRPLFELEGKAIAIDLSGWVVDSQSVTDNVVQPKMYLRNLFFRTAFLLMHEISPVFVLEGKAPVLKHKTIARRNEKRNRPTENKNSKSGARGNFNRILKECEEMLDYMGLKCVRGQGEAESMCAHLNAAGLVDGCVSQDSDCFLYGAKVVYRNFCTSTQGNRGTSSGSIDEYTFEKIEKVLGLGRRKMVALALLCGCDYNEGVNGVGKEAALKLFKVTSEEEILERMKSWRTDTKFEKMEVDLSNPNICNSCGHQGKTRTHSKSGCKDCGTSTKCNSDYKERKILISNEVSIRKKALQVEGFPSQEVIDEFLLREDPLPSNLDLQWKKPQISNFVNFMERHVVWETEYAYAKILPLLTRWQVRNLPQIPDYSRLLIQGLLVPEKIKKSRNIRSISSYEVVWKDEEGIFKGMTRNRTSDVENDSDGAPNPPNELQTLEPQHLFRKCYPELIEEFESDKLSKKKKLTKSHPKKIQSVKDAPEKKVEKKKTQRRPRKPKTKDVNNRKMDEFFKTNIKILGESLEALAITPKRKKMSDITNSEVISTDNVIRRGPQFEKVIEVKRPNNILDGSLLRMFNELTPEDFPSDCDDRMDMSITSDSFDKVVPKNLDPECNLYLSGENDTSNGKDNPGIVLKPKFHSKREKENPFKSIVGDDNANEGIENADCTLARLVKEQKNAILSKKSIPTVWRSPNRFAPLKSKKKFDILNFTYEQQESDQDFKTERTNQKYNISDTFDSSVFISDNLLYKLGLRSSSKLRNTECSNIDSEEADENVKKTNISITSEVEVIKRENSINELNFKNCSFEHLRSTKKFHRESRNIGNLFRESMNSFNISDIEISNDNNDVNELEITKSEFGRPQINPHFEDMCRSINSNSNFTNNEQIDEVQKFPHLKHGRDSQMTYPCPGDIRPIKLQNDDCIDESDLFGSSFEYADNHSSPTVKKSIVNDNKLLNLSNKTKQMIPQDNDCTEESDLFGSSIEYSQDYENSKMETRINESNNVTKSNVMGKSGLVVSDKNESVDEFDLLISNYVPLHQRVRELQKPKIRSSTPDCISAPAKKFSFGIDELLNDTDE